MRTTLTYLQGLGKLNNASSATPSGSAEPVTGLAISTGANSGDFLELSDAQALVLSKVASGTLYAGVYQRVKLSSVVTTVLTGQALFWNLADNSDPYVVTTVEAGNLPKFAGVVIDSTTVGGQWCWSQVTGRATCLFGSTSSGVSGAAVQLFAGGVGANNARFDAASSVAYNIGVSEAAVTANSLTLVEITRAQVRY